MAEFILTTIEKPANMTERAQWARALQTVDAGEGARLELRGGANDDSKCWVVYHGRTNPYAVGNLVQILSREIRDALGIK